jgi:hypothetical protein
MQGKQTTASAKRDPGSAWPAPKTVHSLAWSLLFLVAACTGAPNEDLPQSGSQLFEGPVVTPLALSSDGTQLVRVNPTAASITIFDLSGAADPVDVPVGIEPVSVAFPPGDPTQALVVNHVSDSINVVDVSQAVVVQTIQEVDGDGVTTMNEPAGIAFWGPDRAFVSLDQPNQVIALRRVAGIWSVAPARLRIAAQGPRALAVVGSRLYVAAFESGNKSATATCNSPVQVPYACITFNQPEKFALPVRIDPAAPDRDLFVFDLAAIDLEAPGLVEPVDVVAGVGTLLYGVAGREGAGMHTLWVTHTEARNHLNGRVIVENRTFENRLARLDCDPGLAAGSCQLAPAVDLDAAAGVPVPTPYGAALSGDGATLVVTAAGAEAAAAMPGLFVLDATGSVLGAVVVGSIPQGVVVRSDAAGVAETAYVWNSIDGDVSVVDLTTAGSPTVADTLPAAPSPVPPILALGRLVFRSARASSSGTFACESCHPNGHIDQLVWTLDAFPGEPPVVEPGFQSAVPPRSDIPESRVTLSVRGLRDTLPLHWDGSLGNPSTNPALQTCSGGPANPHALDLDCFVDLVEASLAGVMCDFESCPIGLDGKPGELEPIERIAMAAYVSAVAPVPTPARRRDDDLSEPARRGLEELPFGGLVPSCTPAGANGGCHQFPHGTPPRVAGGFAAQPGPWRTMWDRVHIGSNGGAASPAFLDMENFPAHNPLTGGSLPPVGYDPAVGPDERVSFRSFLVRNFLIDSAPSDLAFQFLVEMSVGYSAQLGRQLTLTPAMVATSAGRAAALAKVREFERAAEDGLINAVGFLRLPTPFTGEIYRQHGAYDPASQRWELADETSTLMTTQALLSMLASQPADTQVTLRADLPPNVLLPAPGFAHANFRQPLLRPENTTNGSPFPSVTTGGGAQQIVVTSFYVSSGADVIVDGARCSSCSLAVAGVSGDFENATITLDPDAFPEPLEVGLHLLQVHPDRGFLSNEIPFKVLE